MHSSAHSSRLPEPDAPTRERSEALLARLHQLIAAHEGWLPFDQYMNEVLYAPGLGYYASGAHKIGDSATGGDFVTAPEISPLFAQALSTQAEKLFESVPRHVLEFGAGTGVLARDLIDALAASKAPVSRYSIVEVSSDLAERQRRLLTGRPVEWLPAPPQGFEGVMIANEVLDVMAVKLFIKRNGQIEERGVGWRGDRLVLAERPAGEELVAAVRQLEEENGADLPDGYASEIGLIANAWMRSVADWLGRGVLFIVDYGFPQREYFHPQRLMGTLMCHYRHHAHADPLWLPGANDVTAHVNFSAVANAAHGAGLDVLGYTTQAHFLLNCGVLDRLQADHGARQVNEAHRLLSEAEMGELVKVMAVGRGVGESLIGFTRGDRRHTL